MRVRLLQNGRPEAIVTFNVQDFRGEPPSSNCEF